MDNKIKICFAQWIGEKSNDFFYGSRYEQSDKKNHLLCFYVCSFEATKTTKIIK
jgi:hypothetical protein